MGRKTFSHTAYASAHTAYVPRSGPATRVAEEQVRHTNKLNPLVDPAEYGVIRRSLVRFEERPDGLFELTIGCSMPIETRVDTTGSMGGNVDIALQVLPQAYGLCSEVLPGFDVHMATGIFGDVFSDRFPLQRPQFEMLAEKLVEQLTLMAPERNGGGNGGEDPHYGIFGGAYLTAAYVNCIGLKRYDFTVSDEPARYDFNERQITRIFGGDVFDKVKANGFDLNPNNLPSTEEVVNQLLEQAHAFFLEVPGWGSETHRFWTDVFGPERVVVLPDTRLLPQVQATIIGLTEGTLMLDEVTDFLTRNNVSERDAQAILKSVANIPIGAQVPLRDAIRVPQKGDLFREKPDVFAKTNLWPIDESVLDEPVFLDATVESDTGPNWL